MKNIQSIIPLCIVLLLASHSAYSAQNATHNVTAPTLGFNVSVNGGFNEMPVTFSLGEGTAQEVVGVGAAITGLQLIAQGAKRCIRGTAKKRRNPDLEQGLIKTTIGEQQRSSACSQGAQFMMWGAVFCAYSYLSLHAQFMHR